MAAVAYLANHRVLEESPWVWVCGWSYGWSSCHSLKDGCRSDKLNLWLFWLNRQALAFSLCPALWCDCYVGRGWVAALDSRPTPQHLSSPSTSGPPWVLPGQIGSYRHTWGRVFLAKAWKVLAMWKTSFSSHDPFSWDLVWIRSLMWGLAGYGPAVSCLKCSWISLDSDMRTGF